MSPSRKWHRVTVGWGGQAKAANYARQRLGCQSSRVRTAGGFHNAMASIRGEALTAAS